MRTIKIQTEPCEGNETGIVVMNEKDYDPEQHDMIEDGDGKPVKGKGKKVVSDDDSPNWSKKNKDELKAHLDAKEVEYDPKASKDELIVLCEKNP